jgi:cytochrome oxidase Cu insertion factor (SCO1/SenC/PrrC family)
MRTIGLAAIVGVVVALGALGCRGGGTSSEPQPARTATPAAVDLRVGDSAPPFDLPASDGKRYKLADYTGKQAVVLAWFAKAFTGP